MGSRVKRWAYGGALLMLAWTGAACKPGSPPTIVDPGNQVAVVGQTLTLDLFASDPDGDALTYDFRAEGVENIDAHAQMNEAPDGHGVFTYNPVAGQEGTHIFDFIVSDGEFETTLHLTIEVRGADGGEGSPVFREPQAGVVLNLTENPASDCASFDVLVEDIDSTMVELTQLPPAIPGAQLDVSPDGFEASWHWCPSREQRETFQYNVSLSADDHDNPATIKDIPIVLRRASGEGCPGEAPVISHTPQDFSTLLDLELTAEVSDDQGLKSPPVVFYAFEDPRTSSGIAWDQLLVADMSLASGDMRRGTWTATIPNPTVDGGVGTEADVFYIIEVIDDDDAEGECDHRTDHPADGAHVVSVENSGDGGAALCEPCSFDVQCGGTGDLCVQLDDGPVCARACTPGDCPDGYTCSADPVTSIEGATGPQCMPEGGRCGDDEEPPPECEDDAAEDDDNAMQAREFPPISADLEGNGTLCPDDPDWWYVELMEPTQLVLTLSGDSPPDMDLEFADDQGETISASAGVTSDESLELGCLDPGEYFAVIEMYDAEAGVGGSYTLDFAFDTAPCEETEDPDSCEGHCGEDAPGGCWCDETCAMFDDCCDDIDMFCS